MVLYIASLSFSRCMRIKKNGSTRLLKNESIQVDELFFGRVTVFGDGCLLQRVRNVSVWG